MSEPAASSTEPTSTHPDGDSVEARPGPAAGSPEDFDFVADVLADDDGATCAARVLRWLRDQMGTTAGMCALLRPENALLEGLVGLGVADGRVAAWSLPLEQRTHPLVLALEGTEPVAIGVNSVRNHPVDTPLGATSLWAVPLSVDDEKGPDSVVGLLVLAPSSSATAAEPTIAWAARILAIRLAALEHRRLRADAQRRQTEVDRLSSVIESVTDPILLTDADGRMLVANDHAEKLFSAEDWMSEGRRHAVGLNNMMFSASLFTSVEESSSPARREVPLVDPIEGHDLLYELLSTSIELGPGETGLVSVLRNVTDLRRATEEIEENYRKMRAAESKTRAERDRLNLILNSAQDPILLTDPGGSIELMNPPAERLFTVATGGDEDAERRVRTNDAVFSSFVSNLFAQQALEWRGELSFTDPASGDAIPVQAISSRVQARPGEDIGVVTILHDLTEAMEKAHLYEQVKRHSEELEEKVREATAELAQQNELLRRQALELEQASAMKSQFLANVSHELRTPLNAIVGYTSLLLEGLSGELRPAQRDKLQRIESNTTHLLAIINDLLDITRIESGKMPVEAESVELSELVHEVMVEVEPLIPKDAVEVDVHMAEDIPELYTDRKKVKQILLNLLSNGLKFTPEGSVSVEARYHDDNDLVSIAVEDTGIGIPEESQKTIFEAFGVTTRSYSGEKDSTGLGLSICRRLAAVLQGEITLQSDVEVGSTFTLWIPRQHQND